MITKIDACLTKPYAKLNIGFSLKKKNNKYWKTPCMSVKCFFIVEVLILLSLFRLDSQKSVMT